MNDYKMQINPNLQNLYNLTQREMDVLRLISEGKTNTEIAEELFITTHTVKVHVASILTKLNVKYRLQAVVVAMSTNLIHI